MYTRASVPTSEYRPVLVHFKKDQIRQLEEHARARGCTRAEEIRRAIDRHLAGLPPEKDIRIEVARLNADTARMKLATAQANAYAREQTRRAKAYSADMKQIIRAADNETRIALARIARGQAVASMATPAVAPPPPEAPTPEPQAEEEPAAE